MAPNKWLLLSQSIIPHKFLSNSINLDQPKTSNFLSHISRKSLQTRIIICSFPQSYSHACFSLSKLEIVEKDFIVNSKMNMIIQSSRMGKFHS